MSETKLVFDRLNEFNWGTWRFRMELMLMREDLWSTVNDSKPESADITSAWMRKDEKARAMIGLALEDSQLSHILDAVSANEMWEKLKGYHERGSLSNKIHVSYLAEDVKHPQPNRCNTSVALNNNRITDFSFL